MSVHFACACTKSGMVAITAAECGGRSSCSKEKNLQCLKLARLGFPNKCYKECFFNGRSPTNPIRSCSRDYRQAVRLLRCVARSYGAVRGKKAVRDHWRQRRRQNNVHEH